MFRDFLFSYMKLTALNCVVVGTSYCCCQNSNCILLGRECLTFELLQCSTSVDSFEIPPTKGASIVHCELAFHQLQIASEKINRICWADPVFYLDAVWNWWKARSQCLIDNPFVGGILKESIFSRLCNSTLASFRVFVSVLNVDDKDFLTVYNVIHVNLKTNKSYDHIDVIIVV